MKREYIKPEIDLIDLLAKEKVMNDEAILFGGNKAMIDDFEQELSPNFGEWD